MRQGVEAQGTTDCPVFIAYRRKDGRAAAEWVYTRLNEKEFSHGGRRERLSVYLDLASPAVGDWTRIHRDALERARAMIVILTPGIAARLERDDWVHMELEWWAKRRDSSPVLVDLTGEGERWTPAPLRKRWPLAQRIDLTSDVLLADDTVGAAQVIERILGGVCESEARTTYQDLELQRANVRRFRVLALVASVAMCIALIAGSFGLFSQRRAEKEAEKATAAAEQARRTSAQADADLAGLLLQGSPKQRPRAVAHLSRALRTRPEERRALERLVSLFVQRPPFKPGEPLRHPGSVERVMFSPDGTRLLTTTGTTVRLWDSTRRKLLAELDHEGHLTASSVWVQFSAAGDTFLTVWDSPDGILKFKTTLQRWNAASGAKEGPSVDFQGPLVAASNFEAAGARVITTPSQAATNLTLWDGSSGKRLRDIAVAPGAHMEIAFSPDREFFVIPVSDSAVQIKRALDGSSKGPWLEHGDNVDLATFDPSGRRLLTTSDGGMRVWNLNSARPALTRVLAAAVEAAAISPDGMRVAVASGNKSVLLLDVTRGTALGPSIVHDDEVKSVVFSSDGKRLLTASADGTVRLWDGFTAESAGHFLGHLGGVNSADFSPDGSWVASASMDATVQLWSTGLVRGVADVILPPSRRQSRSFGYFSLDKPVAAFSPDSRRLIVVGGRSVQLWDPSRLHALGNPVLHPDGVHGWAFSRDGQLMATLSGIRATAWECDGGLPLGGPLLHQDPTSAVAVHGERRRVAVGTEAGRVHLWEPITGSGLVVSAKHGDRVLSIDFSGDGSRFLSRSADGTVGLWSGEDGAPVSVPLRHSFPIVDAKFSPKGDRLLTLSPEDMRLWNARDGRPVGSLLQPGAIIAQSAWSPDGTRIVVVRSPSNVVEIWDVESGRLHLTLPTRANEAQYSDDGRVILTVGGEGVSIWHAWSGQLAAGPMPHVGAYMVQMARAGDRVLTASREGARLWDAITGSPISEVLVSPGLTTSAALSPDGTRMVLGNHEGVRLWNLPRFPAPPEAFLSWVEATEGRRFDDRGFLKEELGRALPGPRISDTYGSLQRWVDTRGLAGTINPWSNTTLGAWLDARLAENTQASLQAAYDALPGDPLVVAAEAERMVEEREQRDLVELYLAYASRHAAVNAEDENERESRPRQAHVWFRVARAYERLSRVHATGMRPVAEYRLKALAAAEKASRLAPEQASYRRLSSGLRDPTSHDSPHPPN
jgi:WD40 repeat protein